MSYAQPSLHTQFRRFQSDYDKKSRKAIRTLSTRYARVTVRERKQQLAGKSARRHQGVVGRITRNGYAVIIDAAPMARQREFGAVLEAPAGGFLRLPVGDGNGKLGSEERFTVRTKAGELLLMKKTAGGAEPIAVLKKKIVVKRDPASGRFATAVNKHLPAYRKQVIEALTKEFRA